MQWWMSRWVRWRYRLSTMLTLTLWLLSMLRSLPPSLPFVSVSPSSLPVLCLHLSSLGMEFHYSMCPCLLNATSLSSAREERVPIAGFVWCRVAFCPRSLFLPVCCRFCCRGRLVCLGRLRLGVCQPGRLRPVLCFRWFCEVGWGRQCSLLQGGLVCTVVMLSGRVTVWCQCVV